MISLYIGTILSRTHDWHYTYHETIYSTESLEDISKKAVEAVNNIPHFDPETSEIIVRHFVEGYEGDDPYLNMVQRYRFANYELNRLGDIIDSEFGETKEMILSDFTDPENRFAVGDICDIYYNSPTGPQFSGSGVITRLRPNPYELPLKTDPYCYIPGYWMSTISTSNGYIHPESYGYAQERLRKVQRAKESPEWFAFLSEVAKQGDFYFSDMIAFSELQREYLELHGK